MLIDTSKLSYETKMRLLIKQFAVLNLYMHDYEHHGNLAIHFVEHLMQIIKHSRSACEISVSGDESSHESVISEVSKYTSKLQDCIIQLCNGMTLLRKIRATAESVSHPDSEHYVSDMIRIFSSIKRRYPSCVINHHGSAPVKFEALYPPALLEYMIVECIENSIKSVSENASTYQVEVLLNWGKDGEAFWVEVHDNGPGFSCLIGDQHFNLRPYSASAAVAGEGLRIISRIIYPRGIKIGRSAVLGGATIRFAIDSECVCEGGHHESS